MKRLVTILFLSLLFCLSISAETVFLHSGKTISGQLLVQTDEVVIIRDANGVRHQYPMSDVLSVSSTEQNSAEEAAELATEKATGDRKASLQLELAGGGLCSAKDNWGGSFSADLLVGSKYIAGREVLLGGAVGYTGLIHGKDVISLLPISVVLRMPLMEGKHAPLFGASLGYGIALSKKYQGGLTAGFDIAYRYKMNNRSALTIGANIRFQQTISNVTDIIEDNNSKTEYSNFAGRNNVLIGLKMGFSF